MFNFILEVVFKARVVPDGSAEFTRKMGMLVKKDNLSFWVKILEVCRIN